MDTTKLADSSFLIEYKEELDEVFQTYLDLINPFIVQFEILKNEFPVELQNEIRAIYGHLTRAAIADTAEEARRNIQKIKSHTKRAVLDCYKYSCIIFTDHYMEFFERYKGVDLSYIDNGNFLLEVNQRYKQASGDLQEAKCAETSNLGEDVLFEMYEKAYVEFGELDEFLKRAEDSAVFLQRKAKKKSDLEVVSLLVGVAGLLVGIFSLIF